MMSIYYLHLEYFIRTKYSKRGIIKLKSLELLAQGKTVITIIKRERYKKNHLKFHKAICKTFSKPPSVQK
jgi:hypothetical protein